MTFSDSLLLFRGGLPEVEDASFQFDCREGKGQ
jgi:hypothetical protein